MENFRDPKVRQQFLQESIAENRNNSINRQMPLADTSLVRRLISLYELLEEQRYNRQTQL